MSQGTALTPSPLKIISPYLYYVFQTQFAPEFLNQIYNARILFWFYLSEYVISGTILLVTTKFEHP